MGLSYGVSKFVMGSVGDRSNARWFLGIGLILSSLMNFAMGWTIGINITNIRFLAIPFLLKYSYKI
ncbi:hypothetical protein [Spiroplasma endosymbiont of Eupeodes luniger]|uniref:hypothetical protein n=1 Tax=Spiroplasma endosymbiont of Eupeodes luniger TaxID=3066300 RepID=UPI0030CBA293